MLRVRFPPTRCQAGVSVIGYVGVLSVRFLQVDKLEIMQTSDERELERSTNELAPTSQVVVNVDWTETDWFKTWLKLARHEPIDKAA